jgi:branched-chain amino acid transport system substrate-binding protein
VGVTADTVTVASIATVGGPLPGATEGAQRGAAAYLAYVNSQGGVHGRRIKLLLGDDQLEPSRARAQFLELEPKVLAFVGSYATADSGYMDLVGRTGVPYFSLSIDPAGRKLRNVVSAQPAQEGYISTAPWAYTRQAYPDVKKLGFLSTGVAAVRINVDGTVAALRRVGYDVVYQAEANPTAPNYTAEIQQMRNRGVEAVMLFAFELNMHVRFIRSMRQQGWNPPLKLSIIAYDSRFFDLLGAAGDGWHEPIYSLPYLDAAEAAANPVLGRFVEWNKRLFPNDKVDLFTVSGWINAELFVEALRKAGPRVTRSALLAAGNAIHDFDASGLYVPSDPGARTTSKCFLMVTGRGGRWVREHPSSGFECGLGEILKFK